MELEVEKISLELQRVRLEPGDILVVRAPEPYGPEVLERISRIVGEALKRADLTNQVLVMPREFELSALAGQG